MAYEVTINAGSVDVVDGADSYQQEGPLTTFFSTGPGRTVVDSWSVRLASYRTASILRVRRIDDGAAVTELTPSWPRRSA